MRSSKFWTFGLSVLAFAASCSLATAQDGTGADGITGITVEGLVLQRESVGSDDFTGPDTVGDPFVAFDAGDLDPDWSAGARVMIQGRLWGMRLQYGVFGAGEFDADKTIFDRNEDGTNATYDDDAHLNPGADVITSNSDDLFALKVEHRTIFAGTEGASLYAVAPGIDVYWGTASFYLDERLKSTAFDDEAAFNGNGDDIDRVRIDSENFLTGIQIGVQGDAPVVQGITFGGSLRGGLMANFITVERSFSSDDDSGNRIDNEIDDTAFAQFVEARPRVSFVVAPGVDLTATGTLIYIHGISEATDYYRTVTDNDDREVRDDGDVFFYGGSLGLTFKLN